MSKDKHNEVVSRLAVYDMLITTSINLLEQAIGYVKYKHIPDEYKIYQKKGMDTILGDLRSMRFETRELIKEWGGTPREEENDI